MDGNGNTYGDCLESPVETLRAQVVIFKILRMAEEPPSHDANRLFNLPHEPARVEGKGVSGNIKAEAERINLRSF